jgi:hypothetical protein
MDVGSPDKKKSDRRDREERKTTRWVQASVRLGNVDMGGKERGPQEAAM